jgi:hypothetical protein
MTTATPIAPATIDTSSLTQTQLKDLRRHINSETNHAFDYLFEDMHTAVRGYASNLLAQSLSTNDADVEPTDDAVDSLTDDLFSLVSVQILVDGINADEA